MEENAPVTPEAPAEGGESTTPEEVSQILGLETPETVTADELEQEQPAEVEEPEPSEGDQPEVETPATPEAPEKPVTTETPIEEVEAPSFAIEVEDANGEKLTINPDDDLEEVLKDFEPKSNGQIFAIIQQITEAKAKQAAYTADQEKAASDAEYQEKLSTIQSGWEKEIETLQGEKRIPATNGDKPNERVNAVFKYMAEENQKRSEAGQPLLQSFGDALDKLELRELREKEVEQAKKDKDLARQRGALVGGSSAPVSGKSPVYRSGTARNSNEALHALGLLDS